jgi:hypothetical protein
MIGNDAKGKGTVAGTQGGTLEELAKMIDDLKAAVCKTGEDMPDPVLAREYMAKQLAAGVPEHLARLAIIIVGEEPRHGSGSTLRWLLHLAETGEFPVSGRKPCPVPSWLLLLWITTGNAAPQFAAEAVEVGAALFECGPVVETATTRPPFLLQEDGSVDVSAALSFCGKSSVLSKVCNEDLVHMLTQEVLPRQQMELARRAINTLNVAFPATDPVAATRVFKDAFLLRFEKTLAARLPDGHTVELRYRPASFARSALALIQKLRRENMDDYSKLEAQFTFRASEAAESAASILLKHMSTRTDFTLQFTSIEDTAAKITGYGAITPAMYGLAPSPMLAQRPAPSSSRGTRRVGGGSAGGAPDGVAGDVLPGGNGPARHGVKVMNACREGGVMQAPLRFALQHEDEDAAAAARRLNDAATRRSAERSVVSKIEAAQAMYGSLLQAKVVRRYVRSARDVSSPQFGVALLRRFCLRHVNIVVPSVTPLASFAPQLLQLNLASTNTELLGGYCCNLLDRATGVCTNSNTHDETFVAHHVLRGTGSTLGAEETRVVLSGEPAAFLLYDECRKLETSLALHDEAICGRRWAALDTVYGALVLVKAGEKDRASAKVRALCCVALTCA